MEEAARLSNTIYPDSEDENGPERDIEGYEVEGLLEDSILAEALPEFSPRRVAGGSQEPEPQSRVSVDATIQQAEPHATGALEEQTLVDNGGTGGDNGEGGRRNEASGGSSSGTQSGDPNTTITVPTATSNHWTNDSQACAHAGTHQPVQAYVRSIRAGPCVRDNA